MNVRNTLKSATGAVHGLYWAFRNEHSFSYVFVVMIITGSIVCLFPVSLTQRGSLVAAVSAILVIMLTNIALKKMCDMLTTDEREKMKIILHVLSAATLVTFVAWSITIAFALSPYLQFM